MKVQIPFKFPLVRLLSTIATCFALLLATSLNASAQEVTDTNTPLHRLQPDYPVPYGKPAEEEVIQVLSRVHDYLDANSPASIVDPESGDKITDYENPGADAEFAQGAFRIISYEWGVTYAGMLQAGQVTGQEKFTNYTKERLGLIGDLYPYYNNLFEETGNEHIILESVVNPQALDDAGAMCAAMVKAMRTGTNEGLKPLITNYIDYISNDQFRLDDGTLARNRPQPNTLWLDDLFMSVPALAQVGAMTGNDKYFDDAVKQVRQFRDRMFHEDKGLFIHGWVQDMHPKPAFYWGRANGWAVMAMVELLDVLPEDHEGYDDVLELLRAHIAGLAKYQSGSGFWHQLLNKTDSYLETSATAIYTYSIAKAINEGWVDAKAYGPMTLLAWNAVSTKVNDKGQVEGTCVGTGMAFDPAFYYHRPINVYAAHGYGPVMLAGSEVVKLIRNHEIEINDSALQFYE